jgi:hypothetical protein
MSYDIASLINKAIQQELTRPYDLKDPSTHPIRYYDCAEKVHKVVTGLSTEELTGAAKVMNVLADYFTTLHFEKQANLNQKTLVKTLDEIRENMNEDLFHKKDACHK